MSDRRLTREVGDAQARPSFSLALRRHKTYHYHSITQKIVCFYSFWHPNTSKYQRSGPRTEINFKRSGVCLRETFAPQVFSTTRTSIQYQIPLNQYFKTPTPQNIRSNISLFCFDSTAAVCWLRILFVRLRIHLFGVKTILIQP